MQIVVNRSGSPSSRWKPLAAPALWVFVAIQVLAVGHLVRHGADLQDNLLKLALLGLGLPALTLLACCGLPPASADAPWRHAEAVLLAALLLWAGLMLGPVKQWLRGVLPEGHVGEVLNAAYKLAVFVALPWLLLRSSPGGVPATGRVAASPGQRLRVFVLLALLAWAVQAAMGQQFQRFVHGDYLQRHWVTGVLACWAWMSLEAGLVEEFFFRRWLQSRLEACTGSAAWGLVLSALLFGLAHAPGIWLRGGGAVEDLADTSLPGIVAYVVSTQTLTGLMFGVLWMRTRSLVLCALVHGMFDTPATVARFMDGWNF